MNTHGLSPRLRGRLAAHQGEACAICGDRESKLEVDHDHSTCHPGWHGCPRCVRGLLCGPCNSRLGRLERSRGLPADAEWLERDRAYMALPPASEALRSYREYSATLFSS